MGPHCTPFSLMLSLSHHRQRALAVHLWRAELGPRKAGPTSLYSSCFKQSFAKGVVLERKQSTKCQGLKCSETHLLQRPSGRPTAKDNSDLWKGTCQPMSLDNKEEVKGKQKDIAV